MGWLERLKSGLSRTSQRIAGGLAGLFSGGRALDAAAIEGLEEILLGADLGVHLTHRLLEGMRAEAGRRDVDLPALRALLKSAMLRALPAPPPAPRFEPAPAVWMLVGVNGAGKTTTVAKLAARLAAEGRRPLMAAGDTFRAAAAEQLAIWAERTQVPLVRHQEGADPAAVLYDAIAAARARKCDVVLADTAGRLHNKQHLMDELAKMDRIVRREAPDAPRETLLVLDATTGQNGLQQARAFLDAAKVTGIIITKLDGTARGGIALAIGHELGLPILYTGVGETADDLLPFDAASFVDSLLGS